MSTANHPQSDGQTEVLNRSLETYLRCFTTDRPQRWMSWLAWAEFCYNTSYQTANQATPFEILYGRAPPTLRGYEAGSTNLPQVEGMLKEREEALRQLKENLKKAKDRMKSQADKHRKERSFEVGDEVYLKLQPYRQISVARRGNQKLSPRFYGPFKILKRVGKVAYTLDLPMGSKIHPTFHVSLLKKKVGEVPTTEVSLPEVAANGELHPLPEKILYFKWKRRNGEYMQEALVQWRNLSDAHNSWVDCEELHRLHPDVQLGDKLCLEGEGNDVNGTRDPLFGRRYRRRRRAGGGANGTEPSGSVPPTI